MGILDDAIREHLELKRQHGAEGDDLERLENEAFGPATRPGDPEYVDQASDETVGPEAADETEAPAGDDASAPGFFDHNADAGESSEESSEWAVPDEEATRIVPPPSTPAEAARADHPELGDTADHPAPDPLPEAAEPQSDEIPAATADPTAAPMVPPVPGEPAGSDEPVGSEPPEAPEHAIFEPDDIDFGDLDLELDDEEPGAAAPTPPPAEPTSADDPQPPPPPPVEDEPPASEHDGDEEEDLLEETPDFLQDAPEGERLWFEQGAPKDFDFDDD